MKKRMNCINAFFMVLLALYTSAFENDLSAICQRPETEELYVGGEFNKIYVVNKVSGETIRQLTIATKVIDMQFNQSGSKLIIYDGSKVIFLNPESGEELYSFAAGGVRLFEDSPYMINTDWIFSGKVTVYSTEDGSPFYTIKPSFEILDAGLNVTRDELIILGRSIEIKGEKGLVQKTIEPVEGYNIYNKAYVEQQNDGQGSGFMVIDLKTKAEMLNVLIPYATSASFGLSISKYKEDYFIACWEMLLKIDKSGNCFPIEVDEPHFAYATNATGNGQFVFISSTKNGNIYNCESNMIVDFNAREDNEFSYSVDFSFNKEEVYLLSDDFSIAILNNKGMVQKRIKIENGTGEGFGLYYYNAFNKKEARDAEAEIINAALIKADRETIDLEKAIGKSDFLLGVFETMEEAEKFQKEIDDNGLQYITKIAPYSSEE